MANTTSETRSQHFAMRITPSTRAKLDKLAADDSRTGATLVILLIDQAFEATYGIAKTKKRARK